MEEIVKKLILLNKTISTMESCTGGMLANEITNIKDASRVFKFGAVTYSNEFKIKFNVDKKTIEDYGVYSEYVAKEMSYQITKFTNSDYGIGITGKLMCQDVNNLDGENNKVYYSIYIKNTNEFINDFVLVNSNNRSNNKKMVIENIIEKLRLIIK